MARAAYHADIPIPENVTVATGVPTAHTALDMLKDLKVYNILNGAKNLVSPYLTRSTVPAWAQWVPVGGMRQEKALECADAFIRSHIWHIGQNRDQGWTDERVHKMGFILGVVRAVIYANYEVSVGRLTEGEIAPTYLTVFWNDDGVPSYRCLVDDPRTEAERSPGPINAPPMADPREPLTCAFVLTEEEKGILPLLVKTAQCVIPLQGYNLINDAHHYMSDKGKHSYKACAAVERQFWGTRGSNVFMEDNVIDVRDLVWHKSGHPVAVDVKYFAATSQEVADNLVAAGLTSAAFRLPAVEPDVRAVTTFLRLADAIKPIIDNDEGFLDTTMLVEIVKALNYFPMSLGSTITPTVVKGEVVLGEVTDDRGNKIGGTVVNSRDEVVTYAKELVKRAQPQMALLYGYYCAMLEANASAGYGEAGAKETLQKAFSLQKLKGESPSSYFVGMEAFKDHQSVPLLIGREKFHRGIALVGFKS